MAISRLNIGKACKQNSYLLLEDSNKLKLEQESKPPSVVRTLKLLLFLRQRTLLTILPTTLSLTILIAIKLTTKWILGNKIGSMTQ